MKIKLKTRTIESFGIQSLDKLDSCPYICRNAINQETRSLLSSEANARLLVEFIFVYKFVGGEDSDAVCCD